MVIRILKKFMSCDMHPITFSDSMPLVNESITL